MKLTDVKPNIIYGKHQINMTKVKQIQLGTVAAAKEPELKLGVLGISIGQRQSTGDTSKIAVPVYTDSK